MTQRSDDTEAKPESNNSNKKQDRLHAFILYGVLVLGIVYFAIDAIDIFFELGN